MQVGQHEAAPAAEAEKDEIAQHRGQHAQERFRGVRDEPAEEFKEKKVLDQAILVRARESVRQSFLNLADLTQTRTALHHQTKEVQIFYIESWLLVWFLIEKGGKVSWQFNLLRRKLLAEFQILNFFY